MENPIKLFVATKALIEKEGKILVLKESNKYSDGTQIGKFDVIGGRIEPGKTIETNLRREVLEETGIKELTIGIPIFVNEVYPIIKGEQTQIIRIFFKCQTLEKNILLSEDHDEHKWIDPKNYKNERLIENLYPVFEEYLKTTSS